LIGAVRRFTRMVRQPHRELHNDLCIRQLGGRASAHRSSAYRRLRRLRLGLRLKRAGPARGNDVQRGVRARGGRVFRGHRDGGQFACDGRLRQAGRRRLRPCRRAHDCRRVRCARISGRYPPASSGRPLRTHGGKRPARGHQAFPTRLRPWRATGSGLHHAVLGDRHDLHPRGDRGDRGALPTP
jgi:hypothetical protein